MAGIDDKVERLQRLVKMLKAENEELVRQGQLQSATPIRIPLKDCENSTFRRTPHTKEKFVRKKSSLSTPIRSNTLKYGDGIAATPGYTTSPSAATTTGATPSKPLPHPIVRKAPPGTVLRLRSQCKELDGQLAELDAENNSLLEQVTLLKSTLRDKDAVISDLEEKHAATEDVVHLLQRSNEELQKKINDLTFCLMATKRWDEFSKSTDGHPLICTCPQKSKRIAVLETRLQEVSIQSSSDHAKVEVLSARLAMSNQRHASEKQQRDRIEHEFHQLVSKHRALEIKCDGLDAQLSSSRGRLKELARQVPEHQHRIYQLESHIATFTTPSLECSESNSIDL
eukprot:m.2325 g.2325  ORF g.2325 m.2325 type:complete len:341 (-) comp1730_c0_seq1:130-1152(-)